MLEPRKYIPSWDTIDGKPRYECEYCGRWFIYKGALNKHGYRCKRKHKGE